MRKPDGFATYDTYIGFRGEERLGGGLSAWFQCESTLNIIGEENFENGFCTRNSGVAFKGGWCNIFSATGIPRSPPDGRTLLVVNATLAIN